MLKPYDEIEKRDKYPVVRLRGLNGLKEYKERFALVQAKHGYGILAAVLPLGNIFAEVRITVGKGDMCDIGLEELEALLGRLKSQTPANPIAPDAPVLTFRLYEEVEASFKPLVQSGGVRGFKHRAVPPNLGVITPQEEEEGAVMVAGLVNLGSFSVEVRWTIGFNDNSDMRADELYALIETIRDQKTLREELEEKRVKAPTPVSAE